MKITFLGTGTSAAMPVGMCPCVHCAEYRSTGRTQRRPAVLVEAGSTRILLDVGPDIREQLISHRVPALDAVFVTHAHHDHFGGLPDLTLLRYGGMKPPPIHVSRGVREYASRYLDWVPADYVVLDYGVGYTVGDLRVTALQSDHGEQFECSLFIVEHLGRKVVYMPDARGPADGDEWQHIIRADVAITDGSYAFGPLVDPLQVVSGIELIDPTHPSREELAVVWDRLEAEVVYLMHVSEHFTQQSRPQMGSRLPASVLPASDGLMVRVG